ncbi:MAG: hypothetical protein LBL79_04870 [Prevotella sp.]|nr:hypothetical protein [Prevotella sp.]
MNDLGECKIEKFAKIFNDYDYVNFGIKFRTDSLGFIKAIICGYCKNCKNSKYTGKLPFGLTFTDNMTEIENKIGKGIIAMEYGFYGRILQWKVQDLYKVSMEVKLPKDDTENLYIEYMIFSKINKE